MTDTDRYFDDVVHPDFLTYLDACRGLTRAARGEEGTDLETAKLEAMRAGRSSALSMNHMLDRVGTDEPAWLPASKRGNKAIREWMQGTYGPSVRIGPMDDFNLLGDVADAFKHFKLTNPRRHVVSDKATIVIQTGYGRMTYGEGSDGGTDQVVVTLQDGRQRALSALLQNCLDGWRLAMGRPLPPINE